MDSSGTSSPTSWRTFRFLRRIGKGGFGEVYLAEMSTGGGFAKPVAIKVLREDYLEDEEVLMRLRDEARLLGQLSHPNIVMADDLVTLAGRLSVVMEYVPGANLNWVINPKVHPEAIPPTVCCQVISRVAEALEAAWSRPSTLTGEPLRVLHRDIKPSNIRLTPDGVIKVLDFGVARAEFNEREADTQDLRMGSVPYMAPEVLLDLPHTPASDIYALGVTFYELSARRRFGKCKLQQPAHEALIDQRFVQANLSEFLLAAEELEDLLRSMLCFEGHMRPSIQEVIQRCRDLERRAVGPRVNEWAPGVIPVVVRSVNIEETEGELIGQTLSEDLSTSGRGSGGAILEESEDPPTEETAVPAALAPSVAPQLPPAVAPPPPPAPAAAEPEQAGGLVRRMLIAVVLLGLGGGAWAVLGPGGEPAALAPVVDPRPATSVSVDDPSPAPPQVGEPESAARPESDPELTPRRGGPPAGRTATKSGDPGTTRTRTEPPPAEPQPESDPPPAAAAVAEPKAERTASPAPETAPAPEPEPDRAPPEPTATQEIAFSSKPLGVAVSVDGVYRGTTPLRVTLTEGPHKVAYDGPDGTRYKTVQVVAGERQVVIYDQAKDVIR